MLVNQQVGRLEVAVDDGRVAQVQVQHALRCVHGHVQALGPVQQRSMGGTATPPTEHLWVDHITSDSGREGIKQQQNSIPRNDPRVILFQDLSGFLVGRGLGCWAIIWEGGEVGDRVRTSVRLPLEQYSVTIQAGSVQRPR